MVINFQKKKKKNLCIKRIYKTSIGDRSINTLLASKDMGSKKLKQNSISISISMVSFTNSLFIFVVFLCLLPNTTSAYLAHSSPRFPHPYPHRFPPTPWRRHHHSPPHNRHYSLPPPLPQPPKKSPPSPPIYFVPDLPN